MDGSLDSVLSEEPIEAPVVETVETQASEPVDTTANQEVTGDEVATTPVEKQEDEIEKHRKGLEAAAMAERRKRQDVERELATLRQQIAQPPAKPTDRPQLGQFGTQEEYLAAVADYEADRAWKQREEADKQSKLQAAEEQHLRNLERTADEIVTRGKQKYADFDAVINGSLAPYLSPALHQVLLMSEQGHEVAYWLGKNPAEAARVAQLQPLHLARELAFIETKLQAAPVKEKAALPETLTQARDTRGRFEPTAYSGPTPLDAILAKQ